MHAGRLPDEQVIALALEAISDHDGERLRPLLDPAIRIVTGRGSHAGIEAAIRWASRRYQHLDRRYVLAELAAAGAGMVGRGRVEYVWRDSGEVGDSAPIYLSFEVEGGRLRELGLHDDPEAARSALGAGLD